MLKHARSEIKVPLVGHRYDHQLADCNPELLPNPARQRWFSVCCLPLDPQPVKHVRSYSAIQALQDILGMPKVEWSDLSSWIGQEIRHQHDKSKFIPGGTCVATHHGWFQSGREQASVVLMSEYGYNGETRYLLYDVYVTSITKAERKQEKRNRQPLFELMKYPGYSRKEQDYLELWHAIEGGNPVQINQCLPDPQPMKWTTSDIPKIVKDYETSRQRQTTP